MFNHLERYSDDKLRCLRREYEDTLDQYLTWIETIQEDQDFFHGKQWTESDVQYLQRQGRPALTFNLIQSKINHLIGAEEDERKEAYVEPRDSDDMVAATVMNRLRSLVYEDGDMDVNEGRAFEDFVVTGIGHLSIEVEADPEDIENVRIFFGTADSGDVMWDLGCRRKDRTDARYMFRARWVTKDQLRAEYPDLTDEEIDEIFNHADSLNTAREAQWQLQIEERRLMDDRINRPMLYYDRRRHQVRVVHMEYRELERVIVAKDTQTGIQMVVDEQQRDVLRSSFPDRMVFMETYQDNFFWVEFVGSKILYDEPSPLPYRDFSLIPFVAQVDRDNLPYGKVRALKDPQRDMNKRHSQALHMITQQGAPGLVAEENALVDEHQARSAMQMGGVVKVKTGFWGKVEERKAPDVPQAVIMMEESAMRLMDLISSVYVDQMREPRGIPEAAATSQLKHRQSLLTTIPILKQFYAGRRRVCKRVLEAIINTYSDGQIQDMLASDKRFHMRAGAVMDMMQPDSLPFPIRDMRTVRYNVRVRASNESGSTQSLMQGQVLTAMAGAGVPVDPELIYEKAGLSEGEVNRLRVYARGASQAQMQSAQFQMQSAQQQLEREFQIKTGELMIKAKGQSEKTRAAMAREYETARGNSMTLMAKLLAIFEKADEAEKNFILGALQHVAGQQSEREAASEGGAADGA